MSTYSVNITIDASADPRGVAAIDEQIELGMRRLMANMQRRAVRLVPKKSRDLMRSIGTEVVREGSQIVGILFAGGGDKDVDYALFVERGTSRMRAQPYLRPALAQTRSVDLTAGAPDA